jgi:glutamate carboxypeptidase
LEDKLNFFAGVKSDFLEMLRELVNVDCGSSNIKGVNLVADKVKSFFKTLGSRYDIKTIVGSRGEKHLLINRPGNVPGKIVMLGHMDTVFPAGTVEKRPFRVEGSKAFGPGVADMKGGIVSLFFVMKAVEHFTDCDIMDIEIVLNSDEEISSPFSREIIEKSAKNASYAMVFEPGRPGGDVVTGRKGIGKYFFEVRGKSAHAGSNHQDGANAIVELAYKTIELAKLTDYGRGLTVNPGLVKGGISPNTVPDQCEMAVDVRFQTVDDGEQLDKRIKEIANRRHVDGTITSLRGGITRPPMERTEGNVKLYSIVHEIGKEIGEQIGEAFVGGGSDGNFTSNLGVPTIDGLGPKGSGFHTENEYLDLDSVVPRMMVAYELIGRLSKGGRI